jgi:hypothetical protein
MALQRYKTQIVKYLSHKDPSIRRRAFDAVSVLIETDAESSGFKDLHRIQKFSTDCRRPIEF